MRSPLQRSRLGAIYLLSIVVVAVIGYRIGGYDWVEAIYMVVITISSVGYGERSNAGPGLQLFSVAVIVFGMSAAVYTIGGFIQMMTEGEIERALGHRRITREIERLSGHVVVCGFGRVGQILAESLGPLKRSFVVIDNDEDRIDEARSRGLLFLKGDAAEEDTLLDAGIERANTIVTSLPNDAANVFITLTCRNLCPNLNIIARAEHESSKKKLKQAGATKIVMPTIIGARQMVRMVTRPSTADLIELVSEGSSLEIELDEVSIPEGNPLSGVTVRETEAHKKYRLLVVAVKQADDQFIFSPDADYTFNCGDIVIIMGNDKDITHFRKHYELAK